MTKCMSSGFLGVTAEYAAPQTRQDRLCFLSGLIYRDKPMTQIRLAWLAFTLAAMLFFSGTPNSGGLIVVAIAVGFVLLGLAFLMALRLTRQQ